MHNDVDRIFFFLREEVINLCIIGMKNNYIIITYELLHDLLSNVLFYFILKNK